MEKIKEIESRFKKTDLEHALLKNYVEALKDEDFKALVAKLKLNENIALKYTSKLERTVLELKKCSKCRSLQECKQNINGCVYYPTVEGSRVRFNYVACKYKLNFLKEEKNRSLIFEEPPAILNARMADIDLTDKKRAAVIKWIQKFYKNYEKEKSIKGAYLHGSFGSGKSFILSALLNELAKKGAKTVIIYYPEMLRKLKESFSDDFEEKMEMIKRCDVLLIDDIGAESVSPWSRDEILGTILQYRMDSMLPTFFTSNLDLEQLETHLSQTRGNVDVVKARRIIERIKQLTEDLELVSENRRK